MVHPVSKAVRDEFIHVPQEAADVLVGPGHSDEVMSAPALISGLCGIALAGLRGSVTCFSTIELKLTPDGSVPTCWWGP